MNAVEIGLYNKLKGDTGAGGVATLSTGGIHHVTAGRNAGYPRTIFQQSSPDFPGYAYSRKAFDHTRYMVNPFAWDTATTSGIDVTAQISERTEALLTDGQITATGKSVIYFRMYARMPVLAEYNDAKGLWIYSRPTEFEAYVVSA